MPSSLVILVEEMVRMTKINLVDYLGDQNMTGEEVTQGHKTNPRKILRIFKVVCYNSSHQLLGCWKKTGTCT
jgi:hypothetical protein